MTKQWQNTGFFQVFDDFGFCHFFVICLFMFLSFSLCFAWFSLNIPNFARHKQNDKKMTKKIEHPKSSKTWKNLVFCHLFVIFLSFPLVFHDVRIVFESFPFNFQWFLLYLFVIYLSLSLCFARFSLNIANFARHKQNDKKMTKKMTARNQNDKKMTRANDKMNDKIIIFMSPSVWLQVSYNSRHIQPFLWWASASSASGPMWKFQGDLDEENKWSW